jgi:hypothetical protein
MLGRFGGSVHYGIEFNVSLDAQISTNNKQTYDFNKANYRKIREYISSSDPNLDNKSTENMWNSFKNTVNEAVEKYVPKKPRRKITNKSKWMDQKALWAERMK